MHILVLNQYYPPDGSATARMAETMVAAMAERHRVTVVCGRPSYEPIERHRRYLFRREAQGNVTVERVGSTAYPRHDIARRLSNYLSFLTLATPRALTVRADVVLAMTDPPIVGVAAAVVARLRGRPFIYNIQDLHPDMTLAAGMVRPSIWVRAWERIHRWALRQAELIVVLGEDMRQRVIAKGVEPERVVIVRNGTHVPSTLPEPDAAISRQIRSGFPFVVLHAGNLGFYGAWDTLVSAARLLNGGGAGLVFVGNGAAKSRVAEMADGCSRVRFLPPQAAEHVPHVLAAGDVHVVTVRRGFDGMVAPSKLYPILAAGRPVLAVAPETSDVARIVSSSGCGVVVDPEDPAAVARAIHDLSRDPERIERMAQRARAVAPEFERRNQLERLVGYVEQVHRSRGAAPCPGAGLSSSRLSRAPVAE